METDPATYDKVLRTFLDDQGRITAMPARHGKRMVILDWVSRVFEPGVRYPEKEVNAMLHAFHPDHAMLRRYLVDFGFLARDHGGSVYWRIGGTVDL